MPRQPLQAKMRNYSVLDPVHEEDCEIEAEEPTGLRATDRVDAWENYVTEFVTVLPCGVSAYKTILIGATPKAAWKTSGASDSETRSPFGEWSVRRARSLRCQGPGSPGSR